MVRNYIPTGAHRWFTKAETLFIRQWAGILPPALIAEILRREPNDISNKLSRMGLPDGQSEQLFIEIQRRQIDRVAEELGEDNRPRRQAA